MELYYDLKKIRVKNHQKAILRKKKRRVRKIYLVMLAVETRNFPANSNMKSKEQEFYDKVEVENKKRENEKLRDEKINNYGQVMLENTRTNTKIYVLSIIGEVEGHENLGAESKTTKYEHILPQLAAIEDSEEIDGVLILLTTIGGAVENGLAIAEMIASLSKPTVSLVLGGSHSIGVPLAVSADYSFIVPTGTMIVHPVRTSGMVIGVNQTFTNLEQIQNNILHFVEQHSSISYAALRELMLDTKQLVKDVGSILVGQEAVEKGIIDEVGGIKEAMAHLKKEIQKRKAEQSF